VSSCVTVFHLFRKLLVYNPESRAAPTDLANHPYLINIGFDQPAGGAPSSTSSSSSSSTNQPMETNNPNSNVGITNEAEVKDGAESKR
jgi:hypothetical protein